MLRMGLLSAVIAVGMCACAGRGGGTGGGSGGSGGSGGGDGGGSGDALTVEERAVADRGNDSSNATQQLGVLADSLFDFDPTIDPAKAAADNAAAIEARVRGNLGSLDGGFPLDGGAVGCGSVSLAGTTVTVMFGAAPGCKLRSGVTVSGTVSVGVTKSATTTTVSLTLTAMVVNGTALSGNASFATTSGTSFNVNGDVTSGTTQYTFTNLSMTGGTGTTTINGAVSIASGVGTTTMTFTAVTWKLGDCYPNGGTLKTQKGLIVTTITFNTSTPTTGQVSLKSGNKTTTYSLPVYGSCGVKDGG